MNTSTDLKGYAAVLVGIILCGMGIVAVAYDPHAEDAGRYFGDEFAEAQRALPAAPREEPAPTF